jgi:hypothetical protein
MICSLMICSRKKIYMIKDGDAKLLIYVNHLESTLSDRNPNVDTPIDLHLTDIAFIPRSTRGMKDSHKATVLNSEFPVGQEWLKRRHRL